MPPDAECSNVSASMVRALLHFFCAFQQESAVPAGYAGNTVACVRFSRQSLRVCCEIRRRSFFIGKRENRSAFINILRYSELHSVKSFFSSASCYSGLPNGLSRLPKEAFLQYHMVFLDWRYGVSCNRCIHQIYPKGAFLPMSKCDCIFCFRSERYAERPVLHLCLLSFGVWFCQEKVKE